MLKTIDPALNADVLWCLRAMGHGDALVIADANFPGDSVARHTVTGELLRMDGTVPQVMASVLSLMPLDSFVDDFAMRMEVVGDPSEIPPIQAEMQAEIDKAEGQPRPMMSVERFDFYDRARDAFAVIQTTERRFYGCVICVKA